MVTRPCAAAAVIVGVYVVKFLLALADTPLCYVGVFLVGRYTGARTAAPPGAPD